MNSQNKASSGSNPTRALARLLPTPVAALLRGGRNRLMQAHFRRINVGTDCYIDPRAHVLGWRTIKLGDRVVISEDSWLNVNNRNATDTQIEIGSDTFIGKRNFFSSGRKISIGDFVLTSIDCKFISSGHVFDDPFKPYITTGTTSADSVVVGVNCWLGVNVVVLGDVTIGHGSVIGANSLVNRSIPPFSLAIGSPARVIKRFDVRSSRWVGVSDFTEQMNESLPSEAAYLTLLRRSHPELRMPVKAAGVSRGHAP